MSPRVFYFCSSDKPEGGLVFPQELELDFYSPGGFYILKELYGKGHSFRAVDGLQETYLVLVQNPDLPNTGLWNANFQKIGNFIFSAIPAGKQYRGKAAGLHGKELIQLFPLNESFFEMACVEHKFFFVGDRE